MRKWIYGLLGIFVIGVAIYYPYSPGGHQAINMRLAEDFIPTLRPKLQAGPRFAGIEINSFTGQGGSLIIFGFVPNEAACEDLRRIILESSAPVPIAFRIRVQPTTTESSTTQP